MTKEYVDKLKVLAELEEKLFGHEETGHRNRNEYHMAQRKWNIEQHRQRVLDMRNDASLPVHTGKEFFEKYIKLLKHTVGTSHEELQRVMALFADEIDFRGMELDRYAEGSDFGSHEKLYLRSTPEEEIRETVASGPDILTQIGVNWSPMGIWEAYLLYAAKDWIRLYWHANYAANDIVSPGTYRMVVAPPWMSGYTPSALTPPETAEGYAVPYPSVRISGDAALIHYVCHKQHDNRYVDRYVVVRKEGESVRFEVVDEANNNFKNVSPVSRIVY